MTLRILAVEDEPPALSELAYALEQCDPACEVAQAGDSTEALRILQTETVDAVFLDINMPGLSGIELAALLKRFSRPPAIVFVTALEHRAVEAFDLDAVDYVVKPFRRERIQRAFKKIVDATENSAGLASERQLRPEKETPAHDSARARIAVERGGELRYLSPNQVMFAEANGDYVRLHIANDQFLVRVSLNELEQRWTGDFMRVHRSYLVRLGAVSALRNDGGKHCIEVGVSATTFEIPVSRRNARELRDAMALRGGR